MSDNLRNFNLTVEEIRIVRMIKELIEGLEKLYFQITSANKPAYRPVI